MIHNSIAQSIPFPHEHAHNKSHSHSQLQENRTAEMHNHLLGARLNTQKVKICQNIVQNFTCPENKTFSMILRAEVAQLFINWSAEEKNNKCTQYKKKKKENIGKFSLKDKAENRGCLSFI